MNDPLSGALGRHRGEESLVRGMLGIVMLGLLLGLAYNFFGTRSDRRGWGLDWIAKDRMAEIGASAAVDVPTDGSAESEPEDAFTTYSSDPLGIAPQQSALPEIPAVGRPVPIELAALKLYVDADAALILDAREPEEFAEGHIAGAINLPYDVAASDPSRIEALPAAGRPVITYCGGGRCEVSISLADELLFAGHERVAVYLGGFPEWQEAGYPVVTGDEGGR